MTQAARHTPGPWRRDKYGSVVDALGRDVVFRNLSMLSAGSDERMSMAEANTDLIAAAPDLLKAAQAQHRALDILMARLIGLDPTFWPTQWEGWQAVVDGSAAISRATTPA